MKKEDFYGKWILRFGDLLPEEINQYSWESLKLTIKCCDYLKRKELIFDSQDEAKKCADNAVALIRGIKNGIYVREDDIAEAPKKPRIYISGPISGLDTLKCVKAFGLIEEKLTAQGYEVFNPMNNGLPQDSPTSQHMRRDLNELTREDKPYDAIYMMKKWNHSAGCWTEFKVACAIGLEILTEQDDVVYRFV